MLQACCEIVIEKPLDDAAVTPRLHQRFIDYLADF
jgi:hypothetical protein